MDQSSQTGPNPPPPASDPPGSLPPARRGGRLKRAMYSLTLYGGVVLVFLVVALGGAEYYTARPDFCGSCHIMDHQYRSWSHDVHGAKIGAKCIDCHYAPGERETIMAKFKGLSQVASYFSGRYGAGRPRAHVADDSCLTSACHGDHGFESKLLPIGEPRLEKRVVGGKETEVTRTPTVHFSHDKHLNSAAQIEDVKKQLAETRARLSAVLPPQAFEQVVQASQSVEPAVSREHRLTSLAQSLGLEEAASGDLRLLCDLERRATRLQQLDGLNCSACHAYNSEGTSHFAVSRTACYTCHFTNEAFNRGTAECLRCHTAPTREIFVHDRATAEGGSAILMDHQDIVRRGIDCASCHYEVVRGDTQVTVRDCQRCHDQDRYLVGFERRTTQTVQDYHAVHIAGQKAHCQDCHRTVQHGLLEPQRVASDTGFLEPVLNDCQHCHPNHHREQLAMLSGSGGEVSAARAPSAMLGSRLNCRACHIDSAEDLKGDELFRASRESCVACHSADYATLFEQWKVEIETYLRECESRLARLTTLAGDRPSGDKIAGLLSVARDNVRLVRVGGGLHNRHHALQLLDAAQLQMTEAEKLIPVQ